MTSIGITGIIGSGKSMLSQVFRSMDIPVYDADSRAKSLMNKNFMIRTRLVNSAKTLTATEKSTRNI